MKQVLVMATVACTLTMAANIPVISKDEVKQRPQVGGFSSWFSGFGTNLAKFNEGISAAMMINPSDTTNDCYIQTQKSTQRINELADFSQYVTGGFEIGQFITKLKVLNIDYVAQLDACNMNKFLIMGDEFLNNIPNLSAGLVNLATQLAVGWGQADSSVFIGAKLIAEGHNEGRNWTKIGQGLQILLSQTLKVQAGEAQIDATPVYA